MDDFFVDLKLDTNFEKILSPLSSFSTEEIIDELKNRDCEIKVSNLNKGLNIPAHGITTAIIFRKEK